MNIIAALIAGLTFGIGLIVSGMINPAKVQNFLDIFGTWDPSLAFVMGGAIAVTFPGFIIAKRVQKPVFGTTFNWPTAFEIDKQLIGGAALFGVGWGLIGLCPGPAITGILSGSSEILIFVFSMIAGMIIVKFLRASNSGSVEAKEG